LQRRRRTPSWSGRLVSCTTSTAACSPAMAASAATVVAAIACLFFPRSVSLYRDLSQYRLGRLRDRRVATRRRRRLRFGRLVPRRRPHLFSPLLLLFLLAAA
jgi:hypothetical protein